MVREPDFSEPLKLKEAQDCGLCMDKFLPDQQVIKLACSNIHILHRHCLEQILKFDKSKKKPSHCPYCRAPIEVKKLDRRTF